MKILGIVGDVCSGKTTIAKRLLRNNLLNNYFVNNIVYLEGDSEIIKMYQNDTNIINQIKTVYPECINNNAVDTKILGQFFFENKQNQAIIESITHPALKDSIIAFVEQNRAKNVLLILDVPILFKLELDKICNLIMFFTADKNERMSRGIARIITKHKMNVSEAKERFFNIDKIAVKKSDLDYNLVMINTTNDNNHPENTIEKVINEILLHLI